MQARAGKLSRFGQGMTRGSGAVFMVIFILIWTIGSIFFDVMLGSTIIAQLRSNQYVETTGVILESDVDRTQTSDGTSYEFVVRYEYDVQNVTLTGDALLWIDKIGNPVKTRTGIARSSF